MIEAPANLGAWMGRLLFLLLMALTPMQAARAESLHFIADATMDTSSVPGRVSLPVNREVEVGAGSQAVARFTLEFRLEEAPPAPLVLAFHASATPQLSINGAALLASPTDPAPNPDPRYVPLRFDLPPTLLRAGLNRLQVAVPAAAGRIALSGLTLGPASDMEAWYHRQLWLGSTGFKVANLAIAGIAHFFLVLWTCRRKESIYGLFSLSGFLWIVCLAPRFVLPAADAMPAVARTMAILAAWFSVSLLVVATRLLDPDSRRRSRWLWAGAALISAALLAVPRSKASWFSDLESTCLLLASFSVLTLALMGMRRPAREAAFVLCVASLALLAGFLSDVALDTGLRAWPAPRLSSYGLLFYVIAVGGWLVNRFIRDREALDLRKTELESEARLREEVLVARYTAAAELDRRYAAAAERERFLAEMHQGLGAHLQQSRELAQAGQLTASAAEGLLNAAVNELRISIESSRSGAQDLLMMLGSLRYRLESRLRRAGIELEWDVDGDMPADVLSPAIIADISRITYEAFSNAIIHSGATRLTLRVRLRADSGIAIEIIDNGRGFDASVSNWGRGLRKVQHLAARMKARWSLSSAAGGTRLELVL